MDVDFLLSTDGARFDVWVSGKILQEYPTRVVPRWKQIIFQMQNTTTVPIYGERKRKSSRWHPHLLAFERARLERIDGVCPALMDGEAPLRRADEHTIAAANHGDSCDLY